MARINPYTPPADAGATVAQAVHSDEVSATVVAHLEQTRPWVKFFAVLGFITVGFMVLGGLVVLLAGEDMDMDMSPVIGLVYMLFAGLYVAPSMFLYRYGKAIEQLVSGGGVPALEQALGQQKSFWRFIGITMAIILGLYGVILLFALVAGIASM